MPSQTFRIILHGKFTAGDLNKKLQTLKRSPWKSRPRKDWPGFLWIHSRCSGSIMIKKEKRLSSGRLQIRLTVRGKDREKLASEFVEWILVHFKNTDLIIRGVEL